MEKNISLMNTGSFDVTDSMHRGSRELSHAEPVLGYTPQQAAEILNETVEWIEILIDRGVLHATKGVAQTWITEESLTKLISQRSGKEPLPTNEGVARRIPGMAEETTCSKACHCPVPCAFCRCAAGLRKCAIPNTKLTNRKKKSMQFQILNTSNNQQNKDEIPVNPNSMGTPGCRSENSNMNMTKQTNEQANRKPVQPAFWTTGELGARWRLRPRTIQNYAARGKLTSTKIGGRHRIPDSAVQAVETRKV
jgi:hypothetical protein